MSLNPLSPRLRNMSKQVAKVTVFIRPDDELVVSDDVAAQIAAATSAVRPVLDEAPAAPAPVKKRPAKKAAAAKG